MASEGPNGFRIETRVEGTNAAGQIVGSGCWTVLSGRTAGTRTEHSATMSRSGKAITARFGTALFTLVAPHTGELVLHEQRRGAGGQNEP